MYTDTCTPTPGRYCCCIEAATCPSVVRSSLAFTSRAPTRSPGCSSGTCAWARAQQGECSRGEYWPGPTHATLCNFPHVPHSKAGWRRALIIGVLMLRAPLMISLKPGTPNVQFI